MTSASRRSILQYGLSIPALAALGVNAQPNLLPNLVLTTGFPPGGNGDFICRVLAEQLRGSYCSNAVVENRTGAGGQIAIAAMKSKPRDGSVALNTVGSTLSLYPHTFKSLQYDPLRDIAPVSLICRFDAALGVGPKVPISVSTIQDLLRWAAQEKGNAAFGTGGAGSSVHLLGSLLGKEAGVALTHVPYRGSLPAIQDLLGGQLGLVIAPVGEFLPHLPGGRVRVLATSGETRNRFTPSVLTLAEQGFTAVRAPDWYGIFLPAGTPDDRVQALSSSIRAALSRSAVIEGLARMGMVPEATEPSELAAMLAQDHAYWGRVVQKVGFTAES